MWRARARRRRRRAPCVCGGRDVDLACHRVVDRRGWRAAVRSRRRRSLRGARAWSSVVAATAATGWPSYSTIRRRAAARRAGSGRYRCCRECRRPRSPPRRPEPRARGEKSIAMMRACACGREHERGVQRARRQRHVVDVERLAGDMAARRCHGCTARARRRGCGRAAALIAPPAAAGRAVVVSMVEALHQVGGARRSDRRRCRDDRSAARNPARSPHRRGERDAASRACR